MGAEGISVVQLSINNEVIEYVANSLEFDDGLGEAKLRPAVSGKGQVKNIYTENPETMKSPVKFQLITTADNVARQRTWKTNRNNNVIEIAGDGLTRTFTGAILTKSPNVKIGVDGVIDCEWECDQAS